MAKAVVSKRLKFDRKAVMERVVERLSTGEPLAAICRSEGFPDASTIWDWSQEDEDIAQAIAQARVKGFDAIAEQCLEIADEEPEYATSGDGSSRRDSGYVAWQKNRIETRLKLLAKWDPKRYGDKTTTKVEGGMSLTVISGVPQPGDPE